MEMYRHQQKFVTVKLIELQWSYTEWDNLGSERKKSHTVDVEPNFNLSILYI